MKGEAKEYLVDEAGADPRHLAAERRALIKGLFDRAWLALKERRISRGAHTFLRWLVEWAKQHGDGDSFTLGERHMQELTTYDPKTIRGYRWQLRLAGLVTFQQKWAFRRGWFYEGRWTLSFASASAGIFPADSAGIIPAYLIRKRLVASTELCPPGDICPAGKVDRDPSGQSSGAGSKGKRGVAEADAERLEAKLPLSSGKRDFKGEASKKPLSAGLVSSQKHREIMGLLRQALKQDFANDAGKWSKRITRGLKQAGLARRCANALSECNKTGKPIRRSRGAYVEDLWKRWRPDEGPDWK